MEDRFKFRAWLNKLNRYSKNTDNLLLSEDGNVCEFDTVGCYSEKDVVIQQCTGLKDIKGKSIYEGDIIVIPNLYPFYDYANKQDMTQNLNETEGIIKGKSVLNYIGIVEWIYSSWQYVYHCVNPQKQGISEGMNNLLNEIGYEEGEITKYEVIGNIYENKELLEERK